MVSMARFLLLRTWAGGYHGASTSNNGKGHTMIRCAINLILIVAVPAMLGRITEAKWTEGKTAAGTIKTAIEVYAAVNASAGTYGENLPTMAELGLTKDGLTGTYFDETNYSWVTAYDASATPSLTYTITVTRGEDVRGPDYITLDQNGMWTEHYDE